MAHLFLLRNILKAILPIFLSTYTFAKTDDEFEKKCKDPFFYSQASEYFACESDMSFDACKGMALSGTTAVGGASALLLSSKITNPTTIAAFKRYTKLQDEYVNLKGQYWAAYNEASRFSQVNDSIVDPFVRKRFEKVRWAYDAMKKNDPDKLAKLEHEWYLLEKEKLRIENLEKDFWYKKLDPVQKAWLPSQYDEKVSQSLRAILAKNQELWSQAWKSNMALENQKVFVKYFPQYADDTKLKELESKFNADKAELDNFRKTALKKNFFGPNGFKSIGKKSAIGALVVGGIATVPLGVQLINDKLCGKLSKDASEYITVSTFNSTKGCQSTFNEGKEAELFMLDNQERTALFERNPVLCASWVKASEKRMNTFPKVKTNLTKCTGNSIGADVEINGRSYNYELSNQNGRVSIRSALGIAGQSKVSEPLRVEWSTNEQSLTTASVKNSQIWSSIDSDKKTIDSINSLYFLNPDSQKKSLSQQNVGDSENYKPVELLSTVAEQTIALKQALPAILSACGYITGSEKSDGSGSAEQAKGTR